MWKISRTFIFSRWPKKQQKYVETNSPYDLLKKTSSFPSVEKERCSGHDQKKKQQFKQNERFWNSEYMHFLLFKSTILEKASWLGTVTILCFNLHFRHFQFKINHENRSSSCLLSRNVFAVPKEIISSAIQRRPPENFSNIQDSEKQVIKSLFSSYDETNHQKFSADVDSLDDISRITAQYAAAVHNFSALSHLKSNKKEKAFQHFQKAARLGSSQAFYNLGLCFQLGKGTRQNLTRAAFCYRKAAIKGHGLASFNLGVFFMKGIGGLPVNREIAKNLFIQAAEKDVPEAQLLVALDCLEHKKYSEAYEMFNVLAQKNVVDGKYYLGMCYENGWGVGKDVNMATELFSEAATAGHSKSILKLSKCYEQGVGGCDADLDFSTALCQLLDNPNDEEWKTTLIRLKLKKATILNKKSCNDKQYSLKMGSMLRTSVSVPELKSYHNKEHKNGSRALLPHPYLHLITPLIPIPANSSVNNSKKSMFYIEDMKVESNPMNAPVQLFNFNLPQMMIARS